MFDSNLLKGKIAGGATVINNADGSFTISGSGLMQTSQTLCYYRSTHEELINLFKVGAIKIEESIGSYPYFSFNISKINSSGSVILTYLALHNVGTGNRIKAVTEHILNDPFSVFEIFIHGDGGRAIIPGTIKPMIYQDGDGTWEPFKLETTTLDTPLTLRALPNGVCDTYENGVITRRVGEILFDGSNDENWMTIDTKNDFTRFNISVESSKYLVKPLCDKLEILDNIPSNYVEEGLIEYEDSIVRIILSNSKAIKVDGLRLFLQSNPIKVWYELKNPKTEQFTIPTLPSYYPYTNVCHNSKVEPINIIWNIKNTFYNKLRKVAFTGSYNDLDNIPNSLISSMELRTVKVMTQVQFNSLETKLDDIAYIIVG